MSHYLMLLILEFLPARLATLPYGLDSNVTQLLLANMLTKPSVFYCLPIVPCNLVSIKLLLLLLLLLSSSAQLWLKKELIRLLNSILPEPWQQSEQLSKLICVIVCKKTKYATSRWIIIIDNPTWCECNPPVRVTRGHWSEIGIIMRLLGAEPCSSGGLLFPSQCSYGTILLTLNSMVWD